MPCLQGLGPCMDRQRLSISTSGISDVNLCPINPAAMEKATATTFRFERLDYDSEFEKDASSVYNGANETFQEPHRAWALRAHTACYPACPVCSSPCASKASRSFVAGYKKWYLMPDATNTRPHFGNCAFTPSLRLIGLLGVLPTMNLRWTKRPL